MFVNGTYLWVVLGVSVFLFFLGFFYSIWLRGGDEGPKGHPGGVRSRLKKFFHYMSRFIRALFSRNFFKLIKNFFRDGIIHVNLFKDSKLKWFIHIFMFWGLLAFTVISVLNLIGMASAPAGVPSPDSSWFVRVFGTLENRFTALVMDLSKMSILLGAFTAVIRFLFLKSKMKSVELKDKSAGVIISIIAVFSFLYEGAFFSAMNTPVQTSAFAPGGFILSYLFDFIKSRWLIFDTVDYKWFFAAFFFYIFITVLVLFVAFIPYGKYSHMVFGPIVAVYNKFVREKKEC
jgi:hypothetical protein